MQLTNEQAVKLIGRQQVQIETLSLLLQELQKQYQELKDKQIEGYNGE